MKLGFTVLAAAVFLAAMLAGYVKVDAHPLGLSVGSDTRYCSIEVHAHPWSCERAG